jgi:ABC-type sugar transport system permease subunit
MADARGTGTGTSELAAGAAAGAGAAAAASPSPSAPAAKKRGRFRAPSEDNRAAYLFLAPALVLIFVFFFLPVAASLFMSFTDFDIYAVGDLGNARWMGGRNYERLVSTPLFWQALRNTFYFALVGGPLSISISLARPCF